MNRHRGEFEIELQGKKYTLRPSFQGMLEMEDRAGQGLMAISQKVITNKAGILDLAAIIYGGMVGYGKPPMSFEEVGEAVMKSGAYKLYKPAIEFLAQAMRGEDPDNKESPGKKAEPESDLKA